MDLRLGTLHDNDYLLTKQAASSTSKEPLIPPTVRITKSISTATACSSCIRLTGRDSLRFVDSDRSAGIARGPAGKAPPSIPKGRHSAPGLAERSAPALAAGSSFGSS